MDRIQAVSKVLLSYMSDYHYIITQLIWYLAKFCPLSNLMVVRGLFRQLSIFSRKREA